MKTSYLNALLGAIALSAVSSHGDTTLNATTSLWEATAPLTSGNMVATGGIKLSTGSESFEFRRTGGVLISKGAGLGAPFSLAISDQGAGTRLAWFGRISAFRAGTVNGTQWDQANIGNFSTAFGQDAKASGSASTALGNTTTAAGAFSTALGISTLAGSYGSTALGAFNVGNGNATTWVATDPLFEVGNGTAAIPANALTVLKNGNTSISGTFTTTGAISTAGQINLTGTDSGIFANGTALLSVNSATNAVTLGSGRPFNITNITPSTNSSSGALTVAGGLGVVGAIYTSADAYINMVRVGRGGATGTGPFANTAVGLRALNINTTGLSNSAFGSLSLFYNTTGNDNTALGRYTLYNNTTGSYNSAIGSSALYLNTTGSGNTTIGRLAMTQNTTGNGNSVMGQGALNYNTTGNFNVVIGNQAGVSQANLSLLLTDPEKSIYIGANTRGFDNNDSNSIVIGADAIGEGANTTVIGNSLTTKTHLHGETLSNSLKVTGATVLNGTVTLSQAQGDISMGIYQ